MTNYLNICLSLPNIGLFTFYLIFVVLMPVTIVHFSPEEIGFGYLKYYMPILVGFANTLTLSGSPYLFENLFPLPPSNFTSWVSTITISLLALMGVIHQGFEYYKKEVDLPVPRYSIAYSLVLFISTFLFLL